MSWFSDRYRRWMVGVAVPTAILGLLVPCTARAAGPEPGTNPAAAAPRSAAALRASAAPSTASSSEGLQLVVNERGHLSRSIAGVTSDTISGGTLTLNKPAGATVRSAYMGIATTGFTSTPLSDPVTIDGQPVPLDNPTPSGIGSYNYFTTVTGLVKPKLDA